MKKYSVIIALFLFINVFSHGIISMAPNITETIYYLQLDSLLIGRTSYCNYPEKAKNIEIVGSFIDFDREKILSLKPGKVIFSNNLTGKEKEFLNNYKIDYLDLKMETIEDIKNSINILSNMYNRDSIAKAFSYAVDSLLNIDTKANEKIYIEISNKPIMCASKNSYIGDIFTHFGYIVFSSNKAYSVFNQEDLFVFNPDIIIIMDNDKNIENRQGWQNINAIKNNRIIYFDKYLIDIFSRPSPRLLECISFIRDSIYENKK